MIVTTKRVLGGQALDPGLALGHAKIMAEAVDAHGIVNGQDDHSRARRILDQIILGARLEGHGGRHATQSLPINCEWRGNNG